MQLGIRYGAEGSLAVRLAWLTALRLGVLTVLLAVTGSVYLGGFTFGGFSSNIALVTLTAAYVVAGLYAVLLRVGRGLPRVAFAQLVTDQITWTPLVYLTGGATSGATSLYGLTCLCGAILLGVRGALGAVASGLGCYFALCAGVVLRIIAPPPDQLATYAVRSSDMVYPVFVNVVGIVVVTALASYLAERLRATGGHLQAVTARAEEAERHAALGRLAAGLAHEIRNPLGAIAGSIELLRTGGSLSAEDERLCAIVARETSRVNDLVGDMLDLSRPRAPNLASMDLSATARDVVTLAGTSGRGADVSLRYEGPEVSFIVADAAQMRQVVWNLLRNAVQVSSPGDEVTVRVRSDDDGFVLEIDDNGPGIAPDSRDRLFDAFFTTRSHGMGIGLAVVKRIVDDHGFPVEVDSEPGKGATFRVRIPTPKAVEATAPDGPGLPDAFDAATEAPVRPSRA